MKFSLISALNQRYSAKHLNYLFWGSINTGFGYCIGLLLYYSLSPGLSLFYIAILINIVCITFSFLTYRFFVFKSKGIWWQEYLRSYVVYGSSVVIGIVLLLFLVDVFKIQFWLAQALLLIISVGISFIGHDKFTFKKEKHLEKETR